MRTPLVRCANGCDRPPDPPSLVICRACMDRITLTLERAVANGRRAAERAALAEKEAKNG